MRASSKLTRSARSLRAASVAAHRHFITKAPVPLSVTAAPTNHCQGRCSYCGIPELGRSEEQSEDWWIETIGALRALGMQRLGFTGGEPLLFSGIDRIVARAQELGVLVSMGTNGLLVRERREVVSRLNYLVVSVDGPKDLNDRQRFEGSYDGALEAIGVARSLGVRVWVPWS